MSLFDFNGRVAVITGSSRGIGRAIAERLAEHGARVVISSRSLEACRSVADDINAARGEARAIAVEANISSKDGLRALVDRTHEAFGSIDVLVCNAATNVHFGPLSGITDEQFRKIFDNNVLSNHWLIQLVAPDMIARRDGAIVIISSVAGLVGSSLVGAYGVSKAADFQLARNLAAELGPHNVRVNCIAPGIVRTKFARALWENPEISRSAEAHTPLRRLGEPDDVAGVAVFLVSPAARFVTGQAIVVDGGATSASPGLGE
ncbi:MAG TPA: SDR family oxidoreductase [Steroidobacteraceae bacterium]|nr:SDR family oxidoreductase [Steroidobacteraceae bacterium]